MAMLIRLVPDDIDVITICDDIESSLLSTICVSSVTPSELITICDEFPSR